MHFQVMDCCMGTLSTGASHENFHLFTAAYKYLDICKRPKTWQVFVAQAEQISRNSTLRKSAHQVLRCRKGDRLKEARLYARRSWMFSRTDPATSAMASPTVCAPPPSDTGAARSASMSKAPPAKYITTH